MYVPEDHPFYKNPYLVSHNKINRGDGDIKPSCFQQGESKYKKEVTQSMLLPPEYKSLYQKLINGNATKEWRKRWSQSKSGRGIKPVKTKSMKRCRGVQGRSKEIFKIWNTKSLNNQEKEALTKELLLLFKSGDENAFETLFKIYVVNYRYNNKRPPFIYGELYEQRGPLWWEVYNRFFYRDIEDEKSAFRDVRDKINDILQIVFLNLREKINKFNDDLKAFPWLLEVVINTAKDYNRKNSIPPLQRIKFSENVSILCLSKRKDIFWDGEVWIKFHGKPYCYPKIDFNPPVYWYPGFTEGHFDFKEEQWISRYLSFNKIKDEDGGIEYKGFVLYSENNQDDLSSVSQKEDKILSDISPRPIKLKDGSYFCPKEFWIKTRFKEIFDEILKLKEEYRDVVLLKACAVSEESDKNGMREFTNLSYEEIGDILNISRELVKSRLFEARNILKKLPTFS